jgi:nucleotide-binding universal stress UspA family protein
VASANGALAFGAVAAQGRCIMTPFQTVVVAVDFSDTSTDTLDAALELVRERHGRLHLLHVVVDVFHAPWLLEAAGIDWKELQANWIEEGRQRLVTFAASHNLDPQSVTTAIAVGPPAAEILRYAKDHGASAIVLGSHGHGIVRRFMLGSVADRVLRQATCPVMLVPHRTLGLTSFEIKAASGVES